MCNRLKSYLDMTMNDMIAFSNKKRCLMNDKKIFDVGKNIKPLMGIILGDSGAPLKMLIMIMVIIMTVQGKSPLQMVQFQRS